MNPLLWLLAGAVLGWLANIEMAADRQLSLALNAGAGAAGALLAGCLATSPLEPDALASSELSMSALLIASLGAVVFLALLNLVRVRATP